MLDVVSLGRAGLGGYVDRQLANFFPDAAAPAAPTIEAHIGLQYTANSHIAGKKIGIHSSVLV